MIELRWIVAEDGRHIRLEYRNTIGAVWGKWQQVPRYVSKGEGYTMYHDPEPTSPGDPSNFQVTTEKDPPNESDEYAI